MIITPGTVNSWTLSIVVPMTGVKFEMGNVMQTLFVKVGKRFPLLGALLVCLIAASAVAQTPEDGTTQTNLPAKSNLGDAILRDLSDAKRNAQLEQKAGAGQQTNVLPRAPIISQTNRPPRVRQLKKTTDVAVAISSRSWSPRGVAVDNAGNVFVADEYNHTILRITPDGLMTTLAGASVIGKNEEPVGGYADGTGSAALFYNPLDVALDSAGNVFVADRSNEIIRKVTPDGKVSTLAGKPGCICRLSFTNNTCDGTGSEARFELPWAVAVNTNNGTVYVSESFSGLGNIRKVTPDGVVTTLIRHPSNSHGAAVAHGVAVDNIGNVYAASVINTILKVTPDGAVTTLAGVAISKNHLWVGGFTDGNGSAALFNEPSGIALDSAGNLYVADTNNHAIRKVSPVGTNWVVTTLAGNASIRDKLGNPQGGYVDGIGGAARFNHPRGVAVDSAGNVYVTDGSSPQNSKIRKVTPDGVVTTIAGPPH